MPSVCDPAKDGAAKQAAKAHGQDHIQGLGGAAAAGACDLGNQHGRGGIETHNYNAMNDREETQAKDAWEKSQQ